MRPMNMGNERFKLFFRALRSEIGDLGLERADQIGGGIDDGATEFKYRVVPAPQMSWQACGVRVQSDA